jgi:putative ABC transport system permease protein
VRVAILAYGKDITKSAAAEEIAKLAGLAVPKKLAILKTLGATRGLVARAFAVEYGCLGLLAGLGGTALGALLAWVVLRLVLDVPFRPDAGALLLSVGLSIGLALTVGALGTFRLLGQPPLAVLRRE